MINDSDNDSWALIIGYVGGNAALSNYAQSIGLTTYNAQNNTISVGNEALLVEKLYDGSLLNRSDTKLILSYMQHTNDEDLIPSAVPSEVTLYHKYGLLSNGEVHDASVMIYNNRPIVLVIYTMGNGIGDYYTVRIPLFQQIVKTVLEYKYNLT
jgi:beta-lactamase class A